MRLFDDVASRISDPMLRRAFELAELGRETTSPNPVVGCVIAHDDEIVGEGYHAIAGGPHAEIVALTQAGPLAAGATAYVTLEPCNHFGRTPPCSEALVTRGIAGVVIGMADPNPVAIGGAVRLREAGIEVEFESEDEPFRIQNEAWLHALKHNRPFVQVKTALTLDGHASLAPGVRSPITGAGGAELTRRLRAAADAVVVGAETARTDDPRLTVRTPTGEVADRQPLRIVLGRESVPDVPLFHDGAGPTAAVVGRTGSSPEGVVRIEYDTERGLPGVWEALYGHGVMRVLVEAGPRLLTALLDDDAAEEYVFVYAGGMAGAGAPAIYSGAAADVGRGIEPKLAPLEAGIIGEDAITVWRPVRAT